MRPNTESAVLPQTWDCHVHVLDPKRFPYRPDRKYTPTQAPLKALIENATAENIVIVQATPEDGEEGLIYHLEEVQRSYPSKIFRGIIVADTSNNRDINQYETTKVDRLHKAGVRAIRVQGIYGHVGSQISTIKRYLIAATASYPVAQLRWTISMQQILEIWAELHDFLLHEASLSGVTVIADHNGNAKPADLHSPAFEAFLDLLRKRPNTYVKVGALHRRAPEDFSQMKDVVKALASAAPQAILWGSDWPHVDATASTSEPSPHIEKASGPAELSAIREWLTDDQFHKMIVENPARVFY